MHLEDGDRDSATLLRESVERLYENERLTDGLTDQSATLLLAWGEQQIRDMVAQDVGSASLSTTLCGWHSLLRQAHRLIRHRASLSELEFTEQTLALLDRAMRFGPREPTAPTKNCP